jgi:hypothetical protein
MTAPSDLIAFRDAVVLVMRELLSGPRTFVNPCTNLPTGV